MSLKRESSKKEQEMRTERGKGGRDERGTVESKEGIHESLSGREQKKSNFIIQVLAKSTDVCVACMCWIFAPARIFLSVISTFVPHHSKRHLKMKAGRWRDSG